MKHTLLASLALICVVCMAGCGSSSGGGSTGGTTFSPAALNGQYAFSLSGYDSVGGTMGMAGSIKADGAGHITGGEIDVNDNGAISSNAALSGTYSFDSGGNGNLGTIVLTNTVGSISHPLAFGFALNAAGTFGTIMDLSANNLIVAGTMQQQSSAVFTLAAMAGSAPYIITVNGRNGSAATSEIGSLTLSPTGGPATGTSFDRSISDLGTAGPDTGNNAAVTFSTTAPDANGRGLFTLFLSDSLATNSTQNFAYYAITSTRFIAVETDGGGTMTADASRQSALTSTSDVTSGAVFGLAGFDTGTTAEVAAVGQLQIAGAPTPTATLQWDSNDKGMIASTTSLLQTVTFNSTTGRGTITVAGGVANGLADTLVFYLSAPGTGFIMDGTGGVTNRAMGGTLTAQTTVSTLATADFSGLALLRSRGTAATDAQSLIGVFGATSTAYAILADQRFPGSSTVLTGVDTTISPLTVGTISANGRGMLVNLTNSGTETLTFYVIGPNQFVLLDTTNGTGASSPVFFATPNN